MVVVSLLANADFRPNNHRQDALHFRESHQEAYLEALKYAKTGPDRTKTDQWRMENVKKSYSTIVDVPEYSKIIEAENVQRSGYESYDIVAMKYDWKKFP